MLSRSISILSALPLALGIFCQVGAQVPTGRLEFYEPVTVTSQSCSDSQLVAVVEASQLPAFQRVSQIVVSVLAQSDADGWVGRIGGPAIDRRAIKLVGESECLIQGPIVAGTWYDLRFKLEMLNVGKSEFAIIIEAMQPTEHLAGQLVMRQYRRLDLGIVLNADGECVGFGRPGVGKDRSPALGASPELLTQGVVFVNHPLPRSYLGSQFETTDLGYFRQSRLFQTECSIRVIRADIPKIELSIIVMPLLDYEAGLALKIVTTDNLRVTSLSDSYRQPVLIDNEYRFTAEIVCDSLACGAFVVNPVTPNPDVLIGSNLYESGIDPLTSMMIFVVGMSEKGSIEFVVVDESPWMLRESIEKRGLSPQEVDSRFATAERCDPMALRTTKDAWSTAHTEVLNYYSAREETDDPQPAVDY